jgi:hypothetical protein
LFLWVCETERVVGERYGHGSTVQYYLETKHD